jgi:membrane protein DedA with SNARE-associated domain
LTMPHHEPDRPPRPQEAPAPPGADNGATPNAGISNRRRRLLYLFLLIASALVLILVTVLVQRPSDPEEYLTSAGYTGVFLMAVLGSAAPVWPLPGSWAAFIAAGLGLNPIFVGLAAGLGEPIGELAYYMLGIGGGAQLPTHRWKWYVRIQNWMRRWGGPTIFAVSAIPNFFVRLATTAAGTLHYPLWKFFIFCWAGKTIKSLAFAFAGAGLFEGVQRLIENVFDISC